MLTSPWQVNYVRARVFRRSCVRVCVCACGNLKVVWVYLRRWLRLFYPPVSWLPLHCIGTVIDFLRPQQLAAHGDLLYQLHSYSLWLGHANSAINPVCYSVMNRRFRLAVKSELYSLCGCVRPPVLRRERCFRADDTGRKHFAIPESQV